MVPAKADWSFKWLTKPKFRRLPKPMLLGRPPRPRNRVPVVKVVAVRAVAVAAVVVVPAAIAVVVPVAIVAATIAIARVATAADRVTMGAKI